VLLFDSGEGLSVKILPFDLYVKIIDGQVEIVVGDESFILKTGQSIIIPAHKLNKIVANRRFKLISTIIKNGCEKKDYNNASIQHLKKIKREPFIFRNSFIHYINFRNLFPM
jgi:gamma-glutamyl phosphate reductase